MLQKNKILQHRALIKAVLKSINLYSETAVELILATGIHEGRNFDFMKQIEGPARSYYQIEPATHDDNFENYLIYNPELAVEILKIAGETLIFEIVKPNDYKKFIKDYISEGRHKKLAQTSLLYNEAYAIAHCRLKYYRAPFKMPVNFNINEVAEIWKSVYNSKNGKGHVDTFIRDYHNYAGF